MKREHRLHPDYDVGYLLTTEQMKIDKSNKLHRKYMNVVQHLAPSLMLSIVSGDAYPTMCASATPGCFGEAGENCIAGAGRLVTPPARNAMLERTRFFHDSLREKNGAYLEVLVREIGRYDAYAKKNGRILALRLNGTSDWPWEKTSGFRELFGMFPDVVYYDYTKIVNRIVDENDRWIGLPENYHLTFSSSETNAADVERVAKHTKVNVAVIFDPKPGRGETPAEPILYAELGKRFLGREVIDGDLHDLRFLDPPNTVVGLRAKGRLRVAMRVLDSPGSGFVTPDWPMKVNDSKLDPDRLREWLDAVAATRVDRNAAYAGPWSTQIGADTWSFATPAHTVLAIRADLGYPPMPSKVSRVVMDAWIETLMNSDRQVVGAGQVSDLARFMGGGGVKMKIGKAAETPTLPVIIGGRVFSSPLVASAIRGAPREEKIRVAMTPSVVDSDKTALFIQGNGWLATVFPTSYDAGDAVPSGMPHEGRVFHEVVPTLGEFGMSGQLELRRPLGVADPGEQAPGEAPAEKSA